MTAWNRELEAQLHEEGLENRWYTAKVLGVPADGVVKVRFDELLENEGSGKLVQVVPVADVRPTGHRLQLVALVSDHVPASHLVHDASPDPE